MVKHCGLDDVGSNGNRCFFTLGWAKPAKPVQFFDRPPLLNLCTPFRLGPLWAVLNVSGTEMIDAGYVHLRQDTVAPHRCNRYRVCCIMSETPGLSLTCTNQEEQGTTPSRLCDVLLPMAAPEGHLQLQVQRLNILLSTWPGYAWLQLINSWLNLLICIQHLIPHLLSVHI